MQQLYCSITRHAMLAIGGRMAIFWKEFSSHFTGSNARKGVLKSDFLKNIILTSIFYGLKNSFVLSF